MYLLAVYLERVEGEVLGEEKEREVERERKRMREWIQSGYYQHSIV